MRIGLILTLTWCFCLPNSLSAKEIFDWVPAGKDGGPQAYQAKIPVVYTSLPKKTSDKKKFRRRYTIDLKKFGISNKNRNPIETSKGINAALQYARKMKKNHIVFPKGTYLVDMGNPIVFNHPDTIVDLNGATLQGYSGNPANDSVAIIVEGAQSFRLTNGMIRGNKDTGKSTGRGSSLKVRGGRELEIDHLVLSNAMLDGITTENGMGRVSAPFHRVYVKADHLEQGGFTSSGVKKATKHKTRSIKPYNITPHAREGQMEFGYIAGYQGFPAVRERRYQAYFYTKGMEFLKRVECLQYKKVIVPKRAEFVHLEFNQPEVKCDSGRVGHITNLKYSRDVHFHHNVCRGNKRLGMAYCGGQRWIIENNMFEENGGRAPGYGVDYEDGWLLTQNVVFRKNRFRNNQRGDLVVCGGSELVFEDNEFEKSATFYDPILSYSFVRNRVKGGRVVFKTRTGIVNLHGNTYENCTVTLGYDGRGHNNGLYRANQYKDKAGKKMIGGKVEPTSSITFKNETFINIRKLSGPYLDFEKCTVEDAQLLAGPQTRLVRFKDSTFKGRCSINYQKGDGIAFMAERCKGSLNEQGNVDRKKDIGFLKTLRERASKSRGPQEDDTEGGVFGREDQ